MENNVNTSPMLQDEKFCNSCGEKIKSAAEICPKCGVRQTGTVVANAGEKSLLTTILLAYFLGAYGAHNFYINRNTKGILSIIFCWTAVPAILSLIDIINFTRLLPDALNEKYNQKFSACEKTVKTIFFVLSVITLIGIPVIFIFSIVVGAMTALAGI